MTTSRDVDQKAASLRVVTPEEREDRLRPHRQKWGDQLRELGETLIRFGDAMQGDDEILGALLGRALADQLPALPSHIREVFLEYLSDEAAAAYKAEQRYFEWDAARAQRDPRPSKGDPQYGI